MFKSMFTRFTLAVLAIALLASGLFFLTGSASAAGGYAGYVYTENNATGGNGVMVFGRGPDGSLTLLSTISTGGTGTGAGLASEGALALSNNGRWLLAVNAGSSDISVISLTRGAVVSRVGSGGATPVSVALFKNFVYVLNHASDDISGFTLSEGGQLTPIPNSTRPLSGVGVDGKQVKFSTDGKVLVVTEKNTNLIDTYTVDDQGIATGPATHASSGPAPFGFDFGKRNTLVVSEAANSAASSYRVGDDGSLNLVSGSVLNGQVAACWVIVTNDGRYAFTADAHNGMISSYAIGHDGDLALVTGTAGTPGGAPLDETVTRNDQFLYVLNPALGMINGFAIGPGASLTSLAGAGGIPASAAGLVAR